MGALAANTFKTSQEWLAQESLL
ncbi:MAG: hypothetical protein K0R61_1326, partial [Microvirga sp.]|nr:hypothetical protein [Microvirga sp.]